VTGGEALVRKDCGAILKKLSELKFNVDLLTNGSLLDERYDEVVPHVNSIVLSLDSENEHTNELNRSAFGFNKILSVIKKLAVEFPEKLVVRSVITANNINEVGEFHKKLKTDYGVRRTIKTMFLPNRVEEIPQIPDLEKMSTANDAEIGERDVYYRCSAGKKIISLSPSGDIFPCQSLMYNELKMANIFDDNWLEKVNSAAAHIMPKLLGEKQGCEDCHLRHFCGGGCPAINYRLYSDFTRKPDFLCPHLKEQAKCRLENMKSDWEEFQYPAGASKTLPAGLPHGRLKRALIPQHSLDAGELHK
jgi:radical SAM protein with 4Fe4S-binding SPASM domain